MKKKSSNNTYGSLSKIKNIIMSRRALFGAAFIVLGLALTAIFWQQTSFAEHDPQNTNEKQAENVWQTVEKSAVSKRVESLPDDFQPLKLNKQRLESLLRDAPKESDTPITDSQLVLQFPMPDGKFSRFRVQEDSVLEEGLAERFPEIKSYRVLGIDRTATTGRFDFTPLGFHATIISPEETISILPADAGDDSLYAVFSNAAQVPVYKDGAICSFNDENDGVDTPKELADAPQIARGEIRKTYRMAFSTTYEYSQAFGCTGQNCTPTTSGVVASINTWLNGLNTIYERELTVKFVMVNNTTALFLTASDPYDDRNSDANYRSDIMLNEVRNQLRDKVGEGNYDIGHLLTNKTIGGVAGLNAVCDPDTVGQPINDQGFRPTVGHRKGGGYSVMGGVVGNLSSLALFAHEVGHQFGANHSHNSTQGREQSNTQYEPGSGNTIMSYFGVTPGDNLVGIKDLRFHGISYDQMTAWISTPVGGQCGTTNTTGNAPPTVSAGMNRTIPELTPFTLTSTGSDPNSNDQSNVTYAWEQFQAAGNATTYAQNGTAASYTDEGDSATTTRPIFRATTPTRGTSRTFPSLEYILNNNNIPPDYILINPNNPANADNILRPGEQLPRIERTLKFRVTARDNVGGVNNAEMTVTVKGNAGPFTVNDPTGTWTGGSTQTVTWNVANTGAGTAVNTANVRISLSTDGGLSFPTTLAYSTPNSGSASVFVPNNVVTSTARIKVEAIDNIFFDISGTNFTIAPGGTCPILTDFSPKVGTVGSQIILTGKNFTGVTGVTINNQTAAFVFNSDTEIIVTVPNNATGGKIAVSKGNACAPTQSTEDFVVCTGITATLQVGDGTEDNIFGQGAKYFVNRLKPTTYPATLSSVTIKYPGYAGFPASVPVTILAGKTANGSVNNTSFRKKSGTGVVARSGETITYGVDPVTVQTGEEFVVGFYIADTSAFFPAARDNSNVPERRSYSSYDGTNFTVEPTGNDPNGNPLGGNYLIKAAAYTGACTSTRCASAISVDDGLIDFPGSPGNTGTQYYINRLTPSSYPATLTGIRMHTPLPAGTSINLLTAASPNGVTNIDNTTFKTKAANIVAPNQFDVYTVDPVTIYSGDFLVGYSVVRNAGEAAISLDNTPLIQNRSYFGGNGTNFNLDGGVNYPIRAVLFSNNCAIGNCTYSYTTSGTEFSAEGGEAVVNIMTQEGCPWQLSRRNDWLTVNIGSGSGSGSVVFNVAENRFNVLRAGSLVVGAPGGGKLFGGNPPETEDVLEILVEQEALAPTAASVAIGGRVLTPVGSGLSGAVVSLVDSTGQTRTARTNPFGYYRFDEIAVGNTIVLNVASKRYTFAPQVVTVIDSIEDLDFVSQE
jgi:hypothetical protein